VRRSRPEKVLQQSPDRRWLEAALAWYFVVVWGSGFIATKIGLQHAAPFTFLTLRFARWMNEKLTRRQWCGIVVGLVGVAFVVWHKVDVREARLGSLVAITISLVGVTAGTLYQRTFCPLVDLRAASVLQFAATLAVLAPLAWLVEDVSIIWSWSIAGAVVLLVIGASILGVNALHVLMRRGQAARVASLVYLTPVIAVVLELVMFGVVPSALSLIGIAITTLGVALVAWRGGREVAAARAARGGGARGS
jgi:drug/metabolite transporter (DMT)-like permease